MTRDSVAVDGSRLCPPVGQVSRNADAAVERLVALGASNLTRGFHTVVSTARARWGPDVDVLAALGHGRSYGVDSKFLVRSLPGILRSGLWAALARMPPAPGRAIVSDVGNDILYGFSGAQVLAWVEEAVDRLQPFASEIIVTDLPLTTIRQLSNRKFLFFRSLFVPRCRLPLAHVVDTVEEVSEGLKAMATRRQLRFVPLDPAWYGFDPIHMRVAAWQPAWQQILCGAVNGANDNGPWMEGLRLYWMFAERQSVWGVERLSPQTGRRLARGGRVWLF